MECLVFVIQLPFEFEMRLELQSFCELAETEIPCLDKNQFTGPLKEGYP